MRVPFPDEEKLLRSLATLARLMSKCATLIYKQQHKSLAPIWDAAKQIRRELLRFAEQQRKDLNFGLVGDPSTGELGVCQTIMSTSKGPEAIGHHPCQLDGVPSYHLLIMPLSISVPPHTDIDIPSISGAARQAAPGGRLFRDCYEQQ